MTDNSNWLPISENVGGQSQSISKTFSENNAPDTSTSPSSEEKR
jgi:hypothetical protein